ncbi:MAG: TIR domain-containing protein [Chromatiaceae bacterium]|nr:TIR domain-containing protein [Chromatiaceae bacterium]
MSGIFISHSSLDNRAADDVAKRLREQGYQALFLDFDPADGIPAGRNWEREIYTRLRTCSGVVLICSEHSMASDWCFAEITHARALGKRIFPLLISSCALRPILRDTQTIDLSHDPETGYQRLWRGMRSAGLDPADTFAWDIDRPPYPGLTPFTAHDAAIFFGREQDQRRCLDRLEQMRRYGGERLLLVVGTSGSGKSSLVRAGVVPRLARMPEWLVLAPLRPGRQPLQELVRVLNQPFAAQSEACPTTDASLLLQDPNSDLGLLRVIEDRANTAGHTGAPVLLVVDQLEELITSSDQSAAARFVDLLGAALEAASGQLHCLATLRADYLAPLQSAPLWRQTRFSELTLSPLTPANLAEIIGKPAAVAGIELEPGLVETLVRDTGSTDALPLLAFTLNRLWRDFGRDGQITLAHYQQRIGGIAGSISQEAEAVLEALKPNPAQLTELRRAFRYLVQIDTSGGYTRRRIHWSDLPDSIRPMLEAFVNARLLISGQEEERSTDAAANPQTTEISGTIEVAHEALFSAWDKLKNWLDQDRAFLLWRQQITVAAEHWRHSPKEQGLLLRGGLLAEAERWLNERDDDLSETQKEFILSSRRQARRKRLAWRLLVAGITVSLVLVTWQAFELSQQRRQVLAQLVNSYWNIAIAARDAEQNALKAAHHFALVADRTSGLEQENALISTGLLTGGVALQSVSELTAPPGAVEVTSDGAVALIRMERQAQLWDLNSNMLLSGVSHREPMLDALLIGERRVASLAHDGSLKFWGAGLPELELTHPGAHGMVVDGRGQLLLSWSENGSLRLWSIGRERELARAELRMQLVNVVFLGSSDRLLAWSDDGQIRVWNWNGTAPAQEWHSGCGLTGATLSPDAAHLLAWCDDALMLYDPESGRLAASWRSPETVDGALFAAPISAILTWNQARGVVRIWEANGVPRFDQPLHHPGSLSRVLLTPDASHLVTCGSGNQINLWDLTLGELAARALHGAGSTQIDARLSADGTRTLVWSRAAGARLWDTATMNPVSLPLLHPLFTRGARFIDQDRAVLSWDEQGELRIWRRTAELEPTAPAAPPQRTQSAPTEAVRVAEVIASLHLDAIDRIKRAGLLGHTLLQRGKEMLLLSSGNAARLLLLDTPTYPLSAPLTLTEPVRGGLLDGDSGRVLLWGDSSVRLWDGRYSRPLGPLLRSDVLFPVGVQPHDGLLTWEPSRARQWRWPAAQRGNATAEHWLTRISGTRLDPNGVTSLERTDWCRLVVDDRPDALPPGCQVSSAKRSDQ